MTASSSWRPRTGGRSFRPTSIPPRSTPFALTLDEDAKRLVALAGSADPRIQAAAIRALGRYETREFTATIAQYLTNGPTGEVATALAQSLRGEPLATDTAGEQVQRVLESLVKAGETSLYKIGPQRFAAIDAITRAIGRLPYTGADQVETAEAFLLLALRRVDDDPAGRTVHLRRDSRDRVAGAAAGEAGAAQFHGRGRAASGRDLDA